MFLLLHISLPSSSAVLDYLIVLVGDSINLGSWVELFNWICSLLAPVKVKLRRIKAFLSFTRFLIIFYARPHLIAGLASQLVRVVITFPKLPIIAYIVRPFHFLPDSPFFRRPLPASCNYLRPVEYYCNVGKIELLTIALNLPKVHFKSLKQLLLI